MNQGKRRAGIAVVAVASLLLMVACSSKSSSSGTTTGDKLGGKVTVVGSWSGAEQDSFLAMVAPWEAKTGTKVNYQGSRDLQAQLITGCLLYTSDAADD